MTIFETVYCQDFFGDDWSGFDVIVCYLSPQHMVRIKENLDRMDKKPLLVTCSFPLPDSEPIETIKVKSIVEIPVMAYVPDLTPHQ
jgi:hypothetical protein